MEDKKGLNRNTLIMNVLLAGSAVLAIMGIMGKNAEILFGGIMVLWMHNCVRSVKNQKARFPCRRDCGASGNHPGGMERRGVLPDMIKTRNRSAEKKLIHMPKNA